MTYDEFIEALIEEISILQKKGKLRRYLRTAGDDGYTDILIISNLDEKSVRLSLGPEVSLLTVNNFYMDDPRFSYDDSDRPEVLSDLIETVKLFLEGSYYEKLYRIGKKEIDRELFWTDDKGNPLGGAMRGGSSMSTKLQRKLPGVKESIEHPKNKGYKWPI